MRAIWQAFSTILLFLDSIVYFLISWVYQIILLLCNVDILDNDFQVQALINRIYIIIGVVVLFLVAYSLLKSMVNPDDTKGKNSPFNVVKNVIVSIVLIALMPTIFGFAMDFQQALLQENTIGKIILGGATDAAEQNSENIIAQGGNIIASTVLRAFLHPDYSLCTFDNSINDYDCSDVQISTSSVDIPFVPSITTGRDNYQEVWNEVKKGDFLSITIFAHSLAHENTMVYYYVISTVAGVFVFLVLLSYCFDIAVRAVKLAVFQLIAPLPILARIMPGEQGQKVFSNWLKATISTYVEVFIRLAILFFAIWIITLVVGNFPSLLVDASWLTDSGVGFTVYLFTQAFIIIGIILFVKQAPQIIKDITGLDGGKYNVFGSAFKAAAMLGGGATTAVRNWNAKNSDGSERSFGQRLRSAASGFGSAAARSAWHRDDVKGLKDVKQNAHNSAEEAIKKRIQRENAKQEQKAYMQEINEQRAKDGKKQISDSGLRAWGKYKAHRTALGVSEWAGTGSDPVALARTQEYASKLDSSFSALEGTWKKSQGFIDAKAEADNLVHDVELYKNRLNEELQEIYRLHNIDEKTASTNDLEAARQLAEEQLLVKYGENLSSITNKYNTAKNRQEGIKLAEQAKKAEGIADQARMIQLANAQYADVKVNMDNVIARYDENYANPDISESDKQKIKESFNNILNKYSDLSNTATYDQFVSDLKQGSKDAADFIDILDKMNLEAKSQQSKAAFAEQQRKGTFNSGKKDGGNK